MTIGWWKRNSWSRGHGIGVTAYVHHFFCKTMMNSEAAKSIAMSIVIEIFLKKSCEIGMIVPILSPPSNMQCLCHLVVMVACRRPSSGFPFPLFLSLPFSL